MAAKDWDASSLGAPQGWSQSLRSALSVCLGSRFPIVLYWGADCVVLYNDAYAEILGKKHPWAFGRPCREVWSEIWDVISPMLDGVLRTGEATWSEDQLLLLERRGFPEECYFSFSFSAVRGAGGGIDGIFTAVIENTRRVLGERRLRTLRDLGARTAIAKDEDDAWRTACAVLAENPADLPFALLYRSEGRLAAGYGMDAPPSLAEATALAGNAQILPVARAGAEPYGHLVAGISGRRPLDDEYRGFLALVADHIATAVANARAYEDERRRAEALAELDRAKTAFFSNVSHEFRTPLTLMLGPLADGLGDAEHPLAPPQRERLEMVLRSALRLQKLVNTLLDFSRIEAGRAQASYVATDLAGFTANLASTFRSAVEKAGLEFVIDCPPLPEAAYVDREMWEKIVLNLLSNAFKFTFTGRIAVSIRMDRAFELKVSDTGGGIPAAELPRIFERFRRVEGAKSRTYEGTGIGLALVQELVKLHGGAVSVESFEGAGSTFAVSIPRGRAHLPQERVGAPRELASTALGPASYVQEALGWLAEPEIDARAEPEAPLRSRIVWADDNADMRAYVTSLLAARYDVEALADGAAALSAVQKRPADLVLADVMMPKLDGLGLVRALRADARTRNIPVILLSARAGEEARIEGLDAGADDYLQKPFGARELLARIAARLELARLQREFESVFAQTPVPIAVFGGEDLVFEMANPAYMAVAGARELAGRPLLEAMPELAEQGFDELLRGVMRSGQAHVGAETRLRLNRGDGELEDTYWTFVYAPLRGAAGEANRVIAICNDVTEQVRSRERIAQSEARYREFLAMLSHELRNPLAPIRNTVSLLQERDVEPELAARALGILERQVTHLIRLVDDLLDITRISRGQISLQKEIVPLAQVVAAAVETSRPLIEGAEHELVLPAAVPGALLSADPVRLAQVIANLLNNAAKFTPRGGRIELGVRVEGASAAISVRDNGAGIAAEDLPRLFEMFMQGQATRARMPGGLGIGLALARQLAELHGGTLAARSDGPGRGAEFTLRVPLSSASESAQLAPHSARPAAAARRILVVDDNRDAADGVAAHLRRYGHEVRTAADGQQALAIARDFAPQVALVDIALPGMSGYELAHRLRGTPALLIALTGHGQRQDRAAAEAAGFHHHFVKPADPREIEATIGAWRPS